MLLAVCSIGVVLCGLLSAAMLIVQMVSVLHLVDAHRRAAVL